MATTAGTGDAAEALAESVREAGATGGPIWITAGGSKAFFGVSPSGRALSTLAHRGIVHYEPTELVLTARAGTPLVEIESVLLRQGQMLGFEPPHYGNRATWGGTIACGWSGPRRPFAGSVRDFVLGCRIIDGRGELLSFGGAVMKNVAGFDVSRLMAGARGTLGILLEVSVKVLPRPFCEIGLAFECTAGEARRRMLDWPRTALPLSALAYDGRLRVRLAGDERTVQAAAARLGGEPDDCEMFWQSLREQTHAFFRGRGDVWRLSVPPSADLSTLSGAWLFDWGGAQRWLRSAVAGADEIFAAARLAGGHATLLRTADSAARRVAPLAPGLAAVHHRLKAAFDPLHLLNRGLLGEMS